MASKAKEIFIKMMAMLFKNTTSSSVPCSNVLVETVEIRLNTDVAISMIRVMMAVTRNTILVKRRSSF